MSGAGGSHHSITSCRTPTFFGGYEMWKSAFFMQVEVQPRLELQVNPDHREFVGTGINLHYVPFLHEL